MKEELKYLENLLDLEDPDFSEKRILKISVLEENIHFDLSDIDDQIDKLKKKKKPLQILLNKIKPYIKQNKLRGSELLKVKGIEK